MKNSEISFEDRILDRFKDSIYKNLIKEMFLGYNKIFWLVYDYYNKRFSKIYEYDLPFFHYYLNFMDYFDDMADGLIKHISEQYKTKKIDNNKSIEGTKNVEVRFFSSEQELNKPKNKGAQKLYVDLNKNDIFKQIKRLLFPEADYFLAAAEDKFFVYDKVIKHRNKADKMWLYYNKKERLITIPTAIRQITGEVDYKSSSADALYKSTEKYFKLQKDKEKSIEEINNNIKLKLRKLS